MSYCIYLRKSRTDSEAEAHGEGETLARHEAELLRTAKRLQLSVTEIKREIVSGETIAARPVMQQLLAEVEARKWEGVLVMEVERLARGDTSDQGAVAKAFQYSGTKIVTPNKTYDPENEFDEEYFEFGLFMSRREYKAINRRLQMGRAAAVREGKFIGNTPPFGYRRTKLKNEKGWILEPDGEAAETVRYIFAWYTAAENRIGVSKIANRLNALGRKPAKNDHFSPSSIRDILRNPAYMGYIRSSARRADRSLSDGTVQLCRPRYKPEEIVLLQGRHEPLVTREQFELAQRYLSENHDRPGPRQAEPKNPMYGVIVCGECGHNMVRRPYQNGREASLICPYTSCKNVSADISDVETALIGALRDWLRKYQSENSGEVSGDDITVIGKSLDGVSKELEKLDGQERRIHDLLEQDVYTVDTFLARSREVAEKRSEMQCQREQLAAELAHAEEVFRARHDIIPRMQHVIDTYFTVETVEEKNILLKSVLEKAHYFKKGSNRWGYSAIHLVVYPKLPKIRER